jgi:hypothetical protein
MKNISYEIFKELNKCIRPIDDKDTLQPNNLIHRIKYGVANDFKNKSFHITYTPLRIQINVNVVSSILINIQTESL